MAIVVQGILRFEQGFDGGDPRLRDPGARGARDQSLSGPQRPPTSSYDTCA